MKVIYRLRKDESYFWVRGDSIEAKTWEVWSKLPTSPNAIKTREISRDEVNKLEKLSPFFGQKVIALAYNYSDLLKDKAMDGDHEPLVFLKSPSSACKPETRIQTLKGMKTWVEVELGYVVNREAKNISAEEAKSCIGGYLVGSDITSQNVHNRDHHLARSKAVDNYAPTTLELIESIDVSDLEMKTVVDGKTTQLSRTSNRLLNDAASLSLISQFMTLKPGDLVLTGTPAGATDSIVQEGSNAIHSIEGFPKLELNFI